MSDHQQPNVTPHHTHNCPKCGAATRCDLQRGKSSCWCFVVQATTTLPEYDPGEPCLCKQCLTKEREE